MMRAPVLVISSLAFLIVIYGLLHFLESFDLLNTPWLSYLYYYLSGMFVFLVVTVALLIAIIVDAVFFPGSSRNFLSGDSKNRKFLKKP